MHYAEAIDTLASVTAQPPLDLAALGLPPYLVPPPAGSTPRQRRQWQRAQAQNLARAGVQPQKIKNSSVATAPGATAVNGTSAPMVTAPHAVATGAQGRPAARRGRHQAGCAGRGHRQAWGYALVGLPACSRRRRGRLGVVLG